MFYRGVKRNKGVERSKKIYHYKGRTVTTK